ncbi:FtsX-like permease family protein [Saccharothrix longispora]|uniref:FtsX-like permease family protein n=1 Tax=Saccharothrix longispora TaxID=33920 RepID=UPI0028FD4A31|nr:FtsX-like permease family protein [Saccharothrix longispora]MBY8847445.1 ABC transporter permease [Saccharothrix sp. MB29]MDU0290714.1 FtsX-like permease family protein [Saccharothrix longispora]
MRWVADLVLGVRLAVGGSRTSWARLALTAAGVGLGVTVLLLAASIGPAREAKSQRVQDAALAFGGDRATLTARQVTVTWQGRTISGVELAATTPDAPAPPGVGRIPEPGELVVSPELFDLMLSDDALRARFPESVIGVIADAGLPRPRSLLFYAGLPPANEADAVPAAGFGGELPPATLLPVYRLLMVAAISALLVPLGIFVLVATRLGATGRAQRLAAIRLVGASRTQVRWMAGGETLTGAVLGLLVGVALFFAARPLARFIEVEGVGFFPTDLLPDPWLGALIAVGVPVVAVLSALLALRTEEVGPLGPHRTTEIPVRRAWWRFTLIGVGAAVVVVLAATGSFWQFMSDTRLALGLGLGIALVLAGTAAVLPWLVAKVAHGAEPDDVARLLALRTLRFDDGTPRVLSGVVVVLAGSLTLQVLLGVAAQFTAAPPNETPDRWVLQLDRHTPVRSLEEAITLTGGVRRISEVRTHLTDRVTFITSTDCAEIAERLGVADCAPGSAYLRGPGPAPGTKLTVNGREWTVPRYRTTDVGPRGLLVADGADPVLASATPTELVVRGDPDESFADRLLSATGRVDRGVTLHRAQFQAGQVELFRSLRSGVIGGSVLLTLLAVIGLAAAAVDQVVERRRPTAVLAANGVPHRVLAASALWQSAIPTALGTTLAIPTGLGTAWLVVPAERFRVDWGEIATTVVAAAVIVLVVSLCTVPALRSAVRPTGLRTE